MLGELLNVLVYLDFLRLHHAYGYNSIDSHRTHTYTYIRMANKYIYNVLHQHDTMTIQTVPIDTHSLYGPSQY